LPAFVSIRNGPFRGVVRPDVRRWAVRMLRALDLDGVELSVVLTDDVEIRELNGVFRQRDKATDVLAFAMREGEPLGGASAVAAGKPGEILGDVVISVETARRQAKEHGRTLAAELQMLLAHGLLHLIGYDHRTDREEVVMIAETNRLCRAARSAKSGGAIRDAAVGPNATRAGTRAKRTRALAKRGKATQRGNPTKRRTATQRRTRRT
jgi:probable rRNA maturation factor